VVETINHKHEECAILRVTRFTIARAVGDIGRAVEGAELVTLAPRRRIAQDREVGGASLPGERHSW